MESPEVRVAYKSFEYEGQTFEIISLEHPEGVECVFTDHQCSCGRLDVGTVGDFPRYWEVEED